ncbi:MAG: class I SAM-dependent rRNA methyltransferase [Bacteroidota bacterium]
MSASFSLPEFPVPARLAIRLKPAAERMVRKQHPWVFDASITKQNKEGKAGDLAIVFDQKKNKFLALGLYDPHSPIRIKLLQFNQGATIDTDWFEQRIRQAHDKRLPLLATATNSYRLLHGENDGLPGLIADVYAQVVVVKLYSLIWLPYLPMVLPIILQVTQSETLVLRLSRNVQKEKELLQGLEDGQVLYGELADPVIVFEEHGVRFSANVIAGHKTGYFLDHRHNRKRVGELAKGKTVLDVFSYAGGFSVHALAGGAKEVYSLDISAQALEIARHNALLNLPEPKLYTIAKDAFVAMEELQQKRKQFDIVVVDPPSFAKKASEVPGAIRSYERLARLAIPLVSKGGILALASCSSRVKAEEFFAVAEQALQQSGRRSRELDRTFHDIDHPISIPEGAYLKCIYFQLD